MTLVRKLKNAVKCRQVGNSEQGEEKRDFLSLKSEKWLRKTLTETLNACMINYNRMEGCYDGEGRILSILPAIFKQK